MFDLCKQSLDITARFGVADVTGAAVDADSLPTARLVLANVVSVAAVVGVTNNATGDYTAAATIPADATVGAFAELQVQAIVDSVTGPYMTVWSGRVVPAMVYDSLIAGTDVLNADVTQLGGVAQSLTDLKDFADAGYDPDTNKVHGVVLVDTCTTNTDMRGTDGAAVAGDEMALTDGAETALVAAIEAEIADDVTGAAVKQAIIDKLIENLPDLDELTLAAIATAVWAEAERTITGGTITTVSDKTGYSLATAPPTAAEIKTELEGAGGSIAQILEDTNELQGNQGDWQTATGFAVAADIPTTDEIKTALEAAGSDLEAIKAAVYDSATFDGVDTVTLSNGATITVDGDDNRTTVEA